MALLALLVLGLTGLCESKGVAVDWAMASNSTQTTMSGEWMEWVVSLLPPVDGATELELIEVRATPTRPPVGIGTLCCHTCNLTCPSGAGASPQ